MHDEHAERLENYPLRVSWLILGLRGATVSSTMLVGHAQLGHVQLVLECLVSGEGEGDGGNEGTEGNNERTQEQSSAQAQTRNRQPLYCQHQRDAVNCHSKNL